MPRDEIPPGTLTMLILRVLVPERQLHGYEIAKSIGTAVYGLLALMLASIGLYGVASYSAARRTNEIGIRMALGADRPNVLALIMRGGMRPIALGLAIGIPAALALGRLIASRLYGVKSYDPLIFASASLAPVMSAMTAAYFPARRATSIEPMRALRSE